MDAVAELTIGRDQTTTGASTSSLSALAGLRIHVQVDLGISRLPLGRALALQPGTRLAVERHGASLARVSIESLPLLDGIVLERERRLAVRLSGCGSRR